MKTDTSLTGLELAHPLAVRLFKERGAPALASEPVRPADLADIASETWRDGCLRKGHPEIPLSDASMRLSLVRETEVPARTIGFKVEVDLPAGQTSTRLFTIYSLRHVAERAVGPLLEGELLKWGEDYFFEVAAGIQNPPTASHLTDTMPDANGPTLSVRSKPLRYLSVPLRPLLQRATPVALLEDDALPVFYTQAALDNATQCARRGIDTGVETGGALFGSLAACPESGEFFVIIDDVIAIEDAQETKFSLSYSSESWQRLQRIQQARQAAFPGRADRLLGQAHSHPFLANGGKMCAECAHRAVCTSTSAWASEDDQVWHKAVFARQPWALCHIFGLTARGEPSDRLYGLADGRLQSRGFYVLPDFDFPENI